MYGAMTAAGIAPATLSRLRAVLHHALEGAVEWDLIAKNPAKYATPPKIEKRERRSLSPAEARILFDAVAADRLQPLWVVLATCGLRISEALALTWDDVTHGDLIIRQGKTAAASRTIPLFADTADALRRREAEQRVGKMRNRDIWHDSRLVFTTKTGLPIYPSSAWRSFKAALKTAGLPDMRLHDLRRTAVAWLREAGVDADVVQVILGHEQLATTLDIYGSVNRSRLEDARRKLDAYLRESS
jgi:integrase